MKKTPLSQIHESLGAKMVEFAGWWMPVQYTGIVDEHMAVRNCAGLFDVSHMGMFTVKGETAIGFLQGIISNDLGKIQPFKAQYSVLMNENGGAVDDIIVYKISDKELLICVNASNIEKDFNWMNKHKPASVDLMDISASTAIIALQGKNSSLILSKIFSGTPARLKVFSFTKTDFEGKEIIVARTGYTGEDGFEIFLPAILAEKLWNRIMDAGREFNLKPCGLGARDTLRLEMGYPLYGHELTDEITPIEAGLERFVSFQKGKFLGRDVLLKQKQNGLSRIRTGILMDDGIPRQGYKIFSKGEITGILTSGTFSPILQKGIGLALIALQDNVLGNSVQVEIRGRMKPGLISKVPFIKR